MNDLRDMTLAEAAAWRAGWLAAREAAARIADSKAEAAAPGEQADAGLRLAAAAIRAMDPPS